MSSFEEKSESLKKRLKIEQPPYILNLEKKMCLVVP